MTLSKEALADIMQHYPAPLVGLAIGDALGAPFEKPFSKSHIVDQDLLTWKGEYRDSRGGFHDQEAGEWTDDTQMSLALAGALVKRRGFDPVTVAQFYLAWFQSVDCRGIGGTTKKALETFAREGNPETCGVVGSEGNGTAMRATPIGMYYCHRPLDEGMAVARRDAQLTHRSLEAEEGSAAVAGMVALLCRRDCTYSKLNAFTEVISKLRSSQIKDLLNRLAVEAVTEPRVNLPTLLLEIGTKGHVLQTVPAAFACFLLTDTYEEAIVSAIRAGGDTDTTAAIAGSFAGAFYRYKGIPEKYLTGLEGHDMIWEMNVKLWDNSLWED